MSGVTDLQELLDAAEQPCTGREVDPRDSQVHHKQPCPRHLALGYLESRAPTLAHTVLTLTEALKAWQRVGDHECDSCDEHGYGDCLYSRDLTMTAITKQRAAIKLPDLAEAMEGK